MKKMLALLLALVMMLSLVACGSAEKTPDKQEESTESSELKVGSTAEGQLFDITIQSVEPVDKIENGYVLHMWSPAEKTNYQDVTADEGYTIVKVSYSYTYKGKEAGMFCFDLTLDYDNGYTFGVGNLGGRVLPAIEDKSRIGFEEYYDAGGLGIFTIEDPLTFHGGETFNYIAVNNEVLSNTDKPLVLKFDIPSSPWGYTQNQWGILESAPQTEPETFTFNLR